MIELALPDDEAASQAATTPEAGASFPQLFAMGTGGLRVLFCDVEVVTPLGRTA